MWEVESTFDELDPWRARLGVVREQYVRGAAPASRGGRSLLASIVTNRRAHQQSKLDDAGTGTGGGVRSANAPLQYGW